MVVNVEKCKVMYFGRNNTQGVSRIQGHVLELATREPDLGIVLTSNMKWKE